MSAHEREDCMPMSVSNTEKLVGPLCGTPLWDPSVGPLCGTLLWDPFYGTPLWDPSVGPLSGTPLWAPTHARE